MEFNHQPIMLSEIILALNIKKNGIYVDCTLGGAGHSFNIAQKLDNSGRLIGIDKDNDALCASKQRLSAFNNVTYVHDDFKNYKNILSSLKIEKVDGVLVDLGVSSYQLDNPDRGFSFRYDSRLDMRMNKEQKLSAYDVVNSYSEQSLSKLIFEYGEEPFARSIARNIVKARNQKPIETTFELVKIIESSMPKKVVYSCGGASKKTFQAIRIEVNGELDRLKESLDDMCESLSAGGAIAVLSFHSLEDRIVKNVLKDRCVDCICPPHTPICICGHKSTLTLYNKKPIIASDEEQKINPRSTCAKLRVAIKK